MTPLEPRADEAALAAAYAQLRRGLLATIRAKVRDPRLAEDLLHDVFAKAVREVREGRAPRHLPAWLHRVVRNTIADHYRARQPDAEPLDDEPPAVEPDDDAAFQALAACLRPLADTLPALYRDALVAAEFEGRALAAIAAAEGGVTVSAIKSRVSRGRKLLRGRLLACCTVAREAGGRVEHAEPTGAVRCACGSASCAAPATAASRGGPQTPRA